jgi:RNA-directed DNA polymerase
MKVWHKIYHKLITKENIFRGYKGFLVGKKSKADVIAFGNELEENLQTLHQLLINKTYKPGGYSQFYVRDPKLRLIHKSTVVDRVVHHLVSRELDPIFEPTFIAHSYSCRKDKGTHKGVFGLQKMGRKVSRNNVRACWALKCDIKKFFASINHKILFEILAKKIKDEDFLDLLAKIIDSFYSDRTTDIKCKKGIPIGNLTSQFFSNIYLNEFDQFIKQKFRIKYYLRYADDFVLLSENKEYLEKLLIPIGKFINEKLDLELHPQKIIFTKFQSGIDFLGYVVFPYHILPRTKTKIRMMRKIRNRINEFKAGKISKEKANETIQSYLGYLSHANAHEFRSELENLIWFWLTE